MCILVKVGVFSPLPSCFHRSNNQHHDKGSISMVSKKKNWPKCVYLENGRIVYKRRIPGTKKFATPIRLGPADMNTAQIWQAYLAMFPERASENSLNWLIQEYFKSSKFKNLKPGTQANYRKLAKIAEHPVDNGSSTIGRLDVRDFTTPMMRRLLDIRVKQSSPSWANRQLAFISLVFTWGMEYVDDLLEVNINPCAGVKKLHENKGKEYVTPEMYQATYNLASEREQVIMEIAYLVACRGQEVMNLKRTDILPEGLLVERLKGSNTNIVLWSPRLRMAIDRSLRLHRDDNLISPYLIPGKGSEGQLPKSTFDTAWQRLKHKVEAAGYKSFTPHALKGTGYTDGEDDNLTGHATEQMKKLYRLKPTLVKPAK